MATLESNSLLAASVRLPGHVVYRAFARETVVLNLQTGKYHGLNPTGARMLEAIQTAPTLRAAAEQLAAEYQLPVSELERDLCNLCTDLLERELIVLETSDPS
jgi:hypothetical protein